MSDSILDIKIPQDDWVELYTESGILSGTPVIIQNKGSTDIISWIGTAKPTATSSDGFMVLKYTSKDSVAHTVTKGNTGVWLRSSDSGRSVSGRVSIQLLDGILPITQVENEALDYLKDSFDFTNPTEPRVNTAAQLVDRAGRSAMVSMTGELHVAGKVDDVNINFQYGLRTADSRLVSTGTGSTGTIKSTGAVYPGTGVGLASIISKNPARYRAGHESHCALSAVFAPPEANLNQYVGYINTDDGFSAGYNGLDFGLWFIEGGNVNFINQADFNIDKIDGTGSSGYNINPQAGNLYRLTFTWHGFLPLLLEVANGLDWIPVHILNFVNIATETHLENPHIPVGIKIERLSGTGANIPLQSGSIRAGSIALTDDDSSSNYWTAHTQLDTPLVPNARTNIFTLRNKTTYSGKTNHVVYELGIVTFDSLANKSVAVYGTKGAIIAGGTAYTDIDTVNSPIEFSNGGTVTGGLRGPATILKAGGDRRTDVRGTGIYIFPGEAFTFEVDPGGAVNGTFSISARIIGRH